MRMTRDEIKTYIRGYMEKRMGCRVKTAVRSVKFHVRIGRIKRTTLRRYV
jgi:hypothetical protein